jgi:hypothetical protein
MLTEARCNGNVRPHAFFYCKLFLLNGTGDIGEYGIGVGADQPDGSDDNHQDHGQHDSVFRDILSFLFAP